MKKLAQHRHEVCGQIRPQRPQQRSTLLRLGTHKILEADLVTDMDKFDNELQQGQYDALVFAAASATATACRSHSGSDDDHDQTAAEQTIAVDRDAAIRLADLCVQHGVALYMISVIGADDPESGHMSDNMRHYMRCKHDADKHIVYLGREHGLRYTILRAGLLTDKGGLGFVTAVENAHRGNFGHECTVSREDVADAIVHLIENGDRFSGRVIGLVSGTEKIAHALDRIVADPLEAARA